MLDQSDTNSSPECDAAHRARPRIVMLLANDFTHDTRVFKQARSLIEWGCEVHVVATAKAHLPAEEVHREIMVHRVPINARSFRDVLFAVGLWWSRTMLRRTVCRADAQPSRIVVEHTAPVLDTGSMRPAGISSNGVVSADSKAGPTQHEPLPAPLNRSLPARAYRRGKVYWRRIRKSVSIFMRRVMSIPGRIYDVVVLGVARIVRRGSVASYRQSARPIRTLAQRSRSLFPPAVRLLALNHRHAAEAIRLRPDIIVAHDLNTLFGAMIVRRVTKTPVVYDSHELYLERNIGDKSRFMDKLFWWPVERAFIGKCSAVMTVADGICDHLQEQYGIPRPTLVRNVQPYEPPAPHTRVLSDELGIDRERAIVLYPGAITINRGLEQLIDSAVHLHGAAYVIMGYAGNPAYLETLKQRARDNGQLGATVFFRDAVPIDDVVRYAVSADAGIVPTQNVCLSYQFESSNKIFHCLMGGVPLAMSDHIEKRRISEQFGVGVLFDETDPRAIAEAVHQLFADRSQYEHMQRNCVRAARELNWEHEEFALRTVYANILEGRARPVPPPCIADEEATVEVLTAPKAGQVHDHTPRTL